MSFDVMEAFSDGEFVHSADDFVYDVPIGVYYSVPFGYGSL
jgi:hypothetical protein